MAYKFQLGHAIMSGALDQDGDVLIKDEAGNVALSLEQDGDLSGSGDFEFGGSVKLLGTAQAAATLAEDAMFYIDASDGLMKRDSFSNYADTAAGVGLGASGGVFSLDLNELGAAAIAAGKKTRLFAPEFLLKMIILPRQARDKHRESTQKKDAFSLGSGLALAARSCQSSNDQMIVRRAQ